MKQPGATPRSYLEETAQIRKGGRNAPETETRPPKVTGPEVGSAIRKRTAGRSEGRSDAGSSASTAICAGWSDECASQHGGTVCRWCMGPESIMPWRQPVFRDESACPHRTGASTSDSRHSMVTPRWKMRFILLQCTTADSGCIQLAAESRDCRRGMTDVEQKESACRPRGM